MHCTDCIDKFHRYHRHLLGIINVGGIPIGGNSFDIIAKEIKPREVGFLATIIVAPQPI
jgi:hypothetical protein